ncbi:sugar phosphate isomerase/epimerase family protein [Acetatifactor muris]|jgi:sugar phosphate isomerase/epimerase|uniref:sugar phosphate isomerase/epimerase family protein n=1 Tax=Acetatifactor muris TaxID=879566 RepID=UPI0023F40ED3|nr:sugar phosphate isomerase/epimerase [Acetatifactor muris]
MGKTEYGLQMYSLRDVTDKDLKGSLEKVAQMGYRYVEFAGFFGHTATEVKSWLDEYGLVCSGTHTPGSALAAEVIDETIAYHKGIGCGSLIIPGMDWSSEEKMEQNIALLNTAQKKLWENGIALGYHNHSAEFFPTAYGKIIEEEIISQTNVELEVDTFWAFNAGIDPVAFCEKMKQRIRVIHLKDGIPCRRSCRNASSCHEGVRGTSVGEGEAPVEAVRDWAIRNHVLMVIESEGCEPTGMEEVKRCISFLSGLE